MSEPIASRLARHTASQILEARRIVDSGRSGRLACDECETLFEGADRLFGELITLVGLDQAEARVCHYLDGELPRHWLRASADRYASEHP